jgi:NAD(P)H dehydrogenase (quinone)
MIIVSAADCILGRQVVEELLDAGVPADGIAVTVHRPQDAADLSARGVQVRQADYTRPRSLVWAFAGAEKLLLISAGAHGEGGAEERLAVDAARIAGVSELVYLSFLHADTSALLMAAGHRETEQHIRESGTPFVFLRVGWFIEHYTDRLGTAVLTGVLPGCAGEGRISFVTRADIACAAAEVLIGRDHTGRTYELGGTAYTLADIAAEASVQCGRTVVYGHVPPEEFGETFLQFGLPDWLVRPLVDAESRANCGELYTDRTDLCRLIRRPTVPLPDIVTLALL